MYTHCLWNFCALHDLQHPCGLTGEAAWMQWCVGLSPHSKCPTRKFNSAGHSYCAPDCLLLGGSKVVFYVGKCWLHVTLVWILLLNFLCTESFHWGKGLSWKQTALPEVYQGTIAEGNSRLALIIWAVKLRFSFLLVALTLMWLT